MAKKQEYYDISDIAKIGAEYNMLIGERANGKSYAAKQLCLKDAWDGKKMVYLRRWETDIKPSMIESYFSDADVIKLTKGACNAISIYQRKIWFSKIDENSSNIERIKCAGMAVHLSGATHYKSLSFNDYQNILFEEFLTDESYLIDEPTKLMNIISTIARRRKISVWLIGNSVDANCPYFREWELVNIPKMQQGQIDVYEIITEQLDDDLQHIVIKIAVEYCKSTGSNAKMFFGHSAKMINTGAWESKIQPHLPNSYNYTESGDVKDLKSLYSVLIKHGIKMYKLMVLSGDEGLLLYVTPSTKQRGCDRVVSEEFSLNPLFTKSLTPITKGDKLILNLIKMNRVAYSDNLTGTEFQRMMREEVI